MGRSSFKTFRSFVLVFSLSLVMVIAVSAAQADEKPTEEETSKERPSFSFLADFLSQYVWMSLVLRGMPTGITLVSRYPIA